MKQQSNITIIYILLLLSFIVSKESLAQVRLLSEIKITDEALYFDGVKDQQSTNDQENTPYDYAYGSAINPHGDCIKTYKQYVFLTWYRGGKEDRHVMLTRYNTQTGSMKSIVFPHQHTGYVGKWWIGETHNTIAIGISPLNGTIHMAYDMHAYNNSGFFKDDYFRYSYSKENVAEIADDEFTLDKFVKDPIDNDYRHCTMNGVRNPGNFSRMTYPKFFLNEQGELFLKMRRGSSYDGAMSFIKYNESEQKWGLFNDITVMGAQSKGETHDWSIYGNLKFSDGKMRLGFQRRLRNGNDKYQYQNGVYYAYCDDPTGASQWKTPYGKDMTFPLVKAEELLVIEPGDYVETTEKNQVYIVGGFDFEVTDRGDEHIVSEVKDKENSVTKKLHTFRKSGDTDFTTVEYDAGSDLYAAGNDIYVIGLKNGRPNIVKTVGGTSNFQQVYQHTGGPVFDKGIVHIANGKLYYYLKEANGSGAKRTTYLQVYDLDIDTTPVDESRVLQFKNLYNNHTIEKGSNLDIEANVGTAYQEVSLWYGNTNLGSLTQPPFKWTGLPELTNMTEKSYNFRLVAKDAEGTTVETTIDIRTEEPASNIFSGEGRYTIYNPDKSKWLGFDVATDDLLVTDNQDRESDYFHVVANGDKFNIYTADDQKVVIIEAATLTAKLGDPTQEALALDDALFSIKETAEGSGLYLITNSLVDSNSGKPFNLNVKSNGSDVGRGTSALDNYQWQFSKIPDVPTKVSLKEDRVKIFPNPAKETAFFQGAIIIRATIYDMMGRKVKDTPVYHNQLALTTLIPGTYLLCLEDEIGLQYKQKLQVIK